MTLKCELKGPASPASPHRPRSNAQAGLSGCTPVITLTSYSAVSREGLTRRTRDLWVLEHWPQGPLRGGLGLSQGGLSSLQLLTISACPSSRCPPSLPPCPHVPVIHNQCHHASEAQEQVPCPCEMPRGPGGHSVSPGGPDQCCCSPQRGVPLLSLVCPSGFFLSSPATGDHQELQGAMAPSSPDAGPSCTGSDEGAQGPEKESAGASKAALPLRALSEIL